MSGVLSTELVLISIVVMHILLILGYSYIRWYYFADSVRFCFGSYLRYILERSQRKLFGCRVEYGTLGRRHKLIVIQLTDVDRGCGAFGERAERGRRSGLWHRRRAHRRSQQRRPIWLDLRGQESDRKTIVAIMYRQHKSIQIKEWCDHHTTQLSSNSCLNSLFCGENGVFAALVFNIKAKSLWL